MSHSSTYGGVGVGVDANGAAFVLAEVQGAVDLGGGMMLPAVQANATELVLAKLDAKGAPLAAKRFSGSITSTGSNTDPARHLALAPDGSVVIVGEFFDTVNLGGAAPISLMVSGDDTFVAKYDTNLGFVWQTALGPAAKGATGTTSPYDVQVDAQGNVLFLGKGLGPPFGPTQVGNFVFVGKLGPDGTPLWAKAVPMSAPFVRGLAVDQDGSVVVPGTYADGTDLGDGNKLSGSGTGVVRYAADGSYRWSRGWPGGGAGVIVPVASGEWAINAGNTFFGAGIFAQNLAVLRLP